MFFQKNVYEPEVQLAEIEINQNCVSNFYVCSTCQTEQKGKIGIFYAIFCEKKTFGFFKSLTEILFKRVVSNNSSKAVGHRK